VNKNWNVKEYVHSGDEDECDGQLKTAVRPLQLLVGGASPLRAAAVHFNVKGRLC